MQVRRATDTLVIGAGPIGLELAAALKCAGVDYVQLEAGQIGQTVSWFPDQTKFFSSPERIAIAGVPLVTPNQDKATREEYLAYLRGVVTHFDLAVNTYERVTSIRRGDGGFTVTSEHHGAPKRYEARHVVVAIGDMHRPRLLHIPGEDLDHVSHYFRDPHRYFRKRVLIVGGRNSAVEAALRCHRIGAGVSISYRREAFDEKSVKYWLLPEIVQLIRAGQIGFYPRTTPVRITRGHVALQSEATGHKSEIACDFVLLLTGYEMDTSLLEGAGVELRGENRAPCFDLDTMETNVPGLYVAGTAAAGTQNRFRLFIENCHVHVTRIVRALTGKDPVIPVNPVGKDFILPES